VISHRAYRYDVTAPALQHRRQQRPHQKERRHKVQVNGCSEVSDADAIECSRPENAGVIYEDIGRAAQGF
jgi:hypothetical protein